MKKIINFILMLTILTTVLNVSVLASSNITVMVDNNPVNFTDAHPFIENNRTMVPVRAIAEAMGANVEWNGETSTVTLTKDSYSSILKIGEYKITISNKNETVVKNMDTKAIVINGRTFIPARFVGYGLGYDVEWKDPVVYYTFINKQTTDFDKEVDPNAKYPNKHPYKPGVEFSYYDGYGDVKVVNGDDGDVVPMKNSLGNTIYKFEGNAFRYNQTPFYMIFDSERLNIDLENKSPEENLKNFKEVFEDISREKVEQETQVTSAIVYYLSFNTVDNVANISYDLNRKIFGLEKYNKYKWVICNTKVMTNFSNYLYLSDLNEYVSGTKHEAIVYDGAEKNTLMLLNTFLGQDGQKIWQMLYEYYNNCGKQYVAPNTYWPYPEMKKPPITKEIVEMYDLEFVEYETDENGFQYTTIHCPQINRDVAIKMSPIGPSHASIGYSILF